MSEEDFLTSFALPETVAELKKSIELQKIEEAFLSCNSMFLRRLRVLSFCEKRLQELETLLIHHLENIS